MGDLERKIKAGRGGIRASILLKNANLVNVLSGEIYPADVAIYEDTIVGIGRYEAEREINLGGKFLCPGLIDAHVHIESSMLAPPLAGLMSDMDVEHVVKQLKHMRKIGRDMGCKPEDPFMALSFLSLPLIPELRVTDRGLVDVGQFRIVRLFGE